MILAAGLGTRMRPLSDLLPKPVLPIRGIPLIAYNLALLARHGVDEAMINVHVQPDVVQEAVRRHAPPGLRLHFSHEATLLGTGGALRRVAEFLAGSDPSLVLGGDMLLDADLGALVARHRAHGAAVTLLLRDDPRADTFGSIGVDAEGCVRRIGRRFDLGGETRAGVYVHATVIAEAALETLPPREVFGHLDAWLAPRLAAGARDIRGEIGSGPAPAAGPPALPAPPIAAPPIAVPVWEPVGTPGEYLTANLRPPKLSYLDADALAAARGVRLAPGLVIGAGARLGVGAELERVVVWDDEAVPAGLRGRDGVFAGGRLLACGAAEEGGVDA